MKTSKRINCSLHCVQTAPLNKESGQLPSQSQHICCYKTNIATGEIRGFFMKQCSLVSVLRDVADGVQLQSRELLWRGWMEGGSRPGQPLGGLIHQKMWTQGFHNRTSFLLALEVWNLSLRVWRCDTSQRGRRLSQILRTTKQLHDPGRDTLNQTLWLLLVLRISDNPGRYQWWLQILLKVFYNRINHSFNKILKCWVGLWARELKNGLN